MSSSLAPIKDLQGDQLGSKETQYSSLCVTVYGDEMVDVDYYDGGSCII